MEIPEGHVVLGSFIREIVRSGSGDVAYRPYYSSNGSLEWEVFLRRPDGREHPVHLARTGERKVFKSAGALLNYHRSMYPEATSVTIPVPAKADSDEQDDASADE